MNRIKKIHGRLVNQYSHLEKKAEEQWEQLMAKGCPQVDCQRDKDYCCDCFEFNLYLSPDQPDPRENR